MSIVMPCLNEAETLEACIAKARSAIDRNGWSAEIVIADNGSTDGSIELAERLGARVVRVPEKGYGSALRGGIAAAAGQLVIMGDADDSYDFSRIAPFVEKLRSGFDLVMGNRFLGGISPGAMPWKHRWIGNPVLTGIGRLFFRAPAGDFHCGLRAFRKAAYDELQLLTTGMEFASEMVIKATLKGLRIAEVPIVLHPDGRSRAPHLRSWRDGWRHLRFMLLFSPRWLFLMPGLALMAASGAVSVWLMGGDRFVGSVGFGVHTLLVAGFLFLTGFQIVVFAFFTKIFAITEGFHPPDPVLDRAFGYLRLETGILAGALAFAGGLGVLIAALLHWGGRRFGQLDPVQTMRLVIPAVVLMMLGIETVFASFFLSILGLRRVR